MSNRKRLRSERSAGSARRSGESAKHGHRQASSENGLDRCKGAVSNCFLARLSSKPRAGNCFAITFVQPSSLGDRAISEAAECHLLPQQPPIRRTDGENIIRCNGNAGGGRLAKDECGVSVRQRTAIAKDGPEGKMPALGKRAEALDFREPVLSGAQGALSASPFYPSSTAGTPT
jgi:hypothetical protein